MYFPIAGFLLLLRLTITWLKWSKKITFTVIWAYRRIYCKTRLIGMCIFMEMFKILEMIFSWNSFASLSPSLFKLTFYHLLLLYFMFRIVRKKMAPLIVCNGMNDVLDTWLNISFMPIRYSVQQFVCSHLRWVRNRSCLGAYLGFMGVKVEIYIEM